MLRVAQSSSREWVAELQRGHEALFAKFEWMSTRGRSGCGAACVLPSAPQRVVRRELVRAAGRQVAAKISEMRLAGTRSCGMSGF